MTFQTDLYLKEAVSNLFVLLPKDLNEISYQELTSVAKRLGEMKQSAKNIPQQVIFLPILHSWVLWLNMGLGTLI